MRNNIGTIDRIARLGIAVTVGTLVFSKTFDNGLIVLGLLVISFCLMVTCLKGVCPIYRLLGINTHKNLNAKARVYEFHQQHQSLLKTYFNYKEIKMQK
jgi:hypothetical protein